MLYLRRSIRACVEVGMTAIASNGTGGGVVSAGASWNGGVAPGEGDTCTIASGDTITIDANWTVGADSAVAAIDVLSGGILNWDNLGNDTVICKGDFYVRNGGTLTLDGTADGTKTLTIQLNYSASLASTKYGLRCENGGIMTVTGKSKTRSYDTLAVAASIGGSTISTTNDNSAVWGATDEIVISGASTQQEKKTLTGIVGAQLTISGTWSYAHGTAYYVGNLTRNIRFIAYNTSYPAYFYSLSNPAGSTIQNIFSWVEFKDIIVKSGLTTLVGTYFTKASLTYCSAWLTASGLGGIGIANPTGGYSISNYNVSYCAGNTSSYGYYMAGLTAASSSATINYNLSIGTGSAGIQIAGCTGISVSGNICHNGGSGLYFVSSPAGLTINGGEMRTQTSLGLRIETLYASTVSNLTIADCATAIRLTSCAKVTLTGLTTSGTTTDILFNLGYVEAYIYDSTLGGSTKVSGTPIDGTRLRMKNVTNVDTGHRTFADYGQYARQGATVRSGSYAMIISPTSATNPLTAESTVPGINGVQIVVSAYFQKNAAYGSSNLPFLRLSGIGLVTSTATMTDVNATWELLVVSGTPTEDGFAKVEFVTQSSGIGAACYVDDVKMVYTAIDTGAMDYWYQGNVPPVLMSTGLGATDVWQAATSGLTAAGSIGKLLTDDIDAKISSRLASGSYTAPLDAAGTRGAVGLASANLDTQLAAIPTDLDVQADAAAALTAYGAAATGDAMTLTALERDSVAAATLDLSNAIEMNLTLREALRLIAASAAGKLSGAATATITIRNARADNKNRIIATVDANGNRTAITYDVS